MKSCACSVWRAFRTYQSSKKQPFSPYLPVLFLLIILLVASPGCRNLASSDEHATSIPPSSLTVAPISPSSQAVITSTSEASGGTDTVPIGVLQAYLYKPPEDGTTANDIAHLADLIILTKKDEPFRDDVRQDGYDGLVLQYVVSNEAEGPTTAITSTTPCDMTFSPWHNQVAYEPGDFCRAIHPNEDWFLHNGSGERLYGTIQGRRYYYMNPSNQEWRRFAIGRMVRFLEGDESHAPLGYDGIFLDNVDLSLDKVLLRKENSDGTIKEFTSDAAYRAAWIGYLRDLSDALRPRWKIWANMASDPLNGQSWAPYMEYLDGGMSEAFATGWPWVDPYSHTEWDASLTQAENVLAMGKQYLAQSQGNDESLQQFALASYLLITDGRNAFFRYSIRSDYTTWTQYPNYTINMGEPLGPRYRQGDSHWRRDFRNGYVIVNPIAQTSEIILLE